MSSNAAGPRGIGGWLILPTIGLFLTPIVAGILLVTQYVPIFATGQWAELTTPGRPNYHPLWGPTLIYEMLGNLFVMGYAIILLVLLFRRHQLFPKLMIAFYLINLGYSIADLVLANQIPLVAAQAGAQAMQQVARSAVGAAIWIPYFLVSVRVKNTFGQPEDDDRFRDDFPDRDSRYDDADLGPPNPNAPASDQYRPSN